MNKPLIYAIGAALFSGTMAYVLLIYIPQKNAIKAGDSISAKTNGVNIYRKSDNGIYRTAAAGDYIMVVTSEDDNNYYGVTASGSQVYVSKKTVEKAA